MKKIFASIFFVFVLCANAAEISIGKTKIKLSDFPGYINSADVHPELNAHLSRFTQDQYFVPASYILTSDAELIKNNPNKRFFEEKTYQSHIMFMYLKKLADYSVKQNEFNIIKAELKKVYASNFKQLDQKLKDVENHISSKMDGSYNIDKMIPAGIFYENDDCIIGSVVANHKFDNTVFSQVTSMAILKIKNKLLYVYVFKNFKNKNDLEYTQKNLKLLVQKIFEANK